MNYMSEAGSHHGYDNSNNQDAVIFKKNKEYCVMVLADGVSACNKSAEGARIVCNAVSEYLLAHGKRLIQMNRKYVAEYLLTYVMFKLNEIASETQIDVNEYSSTLAFVFADRRNGKMLYFSIGDSLIIAVRNSGCSIVAMPGDSRNGCCVTTTYNASVMAEVGVVDTDNINSVFICSDGAWHLMYKRNRMYESFKSLLINQEYVKLKDVLSSAERYDDCSFISADISDLRRGKRK